MSGIEWMVSELLAMPKWTPDRFDRRFFRSST